MKSWLILLTFPFLAQQTSQYDACMLFESFIQNKGSVLEGSKCVFKFPFQNQTNTPIHITVKSSCGCLVPWWNSNPILPGAWDTIYAQYDTKRLGNFQKTLTVFSSCDNPNTTYTTLFVKGEVLPKQPKGLLIFFDNEVLPRIPNRRNHIVLDEACFPFKIRFWNYSDSPISLVVTSKRTNEKWSIKLDPKSAYDFDQLMLFIHFQNEDFTIHVNNESRVYISKQDSK